MSNSSLVSGLRLLYSVITQTVNVENLVLGTTPAENMAVPLPDGVVGTGFNSVPAGAVDMPFCLLTENQPVGQQFVDFVLLLTDQEISFKTQGPSSTPIPVRAGGMALLDSKNISSVLVSNGGSSPARVLFVQARWQPIP